MAARSDLGNFCLGTSIRRATTVPTRRMMMLPGQREACILARAARGQHTPQRDDGNPSASLRLAAWDLRSGVTRGPRASEDTQNDCASQGHPRCPVGLTRQSGGAKRLRPCVWGTHSSVSNAQQCMVAMRPLRCEASPKVLALAPDFWWNLPSITSCLFSENMLY